MYLPRIEPVEGDIIHHLRFSILEEVGVCMIRLLSFQFNHIDKLRVQVVKIIISREDG